MNMDDDIQHPASDRSTQTRNIRLLLSKADLQANPLYFRLKSPPTILPYRVRTISHVQDNPHHATLGTYLDDAMLIICLAGQGRYQWVGQTLRIHRGMIGLILPGQEPGLLTADPDDPYEHLSCRFAGDEALRTARRIVEEKGHKRFFSVPQWHEVAESLRRGIVHWPGREGIQPSRSDRLRRVDAILAETLACLEAPVETTHQGLSAQSLWEYMHVYISQPINLDQAAAFFGISKQHLCKVARQLLGQSMGQTWTIMKIDWAKSLLQKEKISITQIARKVGYEDPLYFSRVFRSRLGMSPRQWRAHQQVSQQDTK